MHMSVSGIADMRVMWHDGIWRSRRALEHRKNMDEERLYVLEQNLKDTTEATVESEKRYDEVLHLFSYLSLDWML